MSSLCYCIEYFAKQCTATVETYKSETNEAKNQKRYDKHWEELTNVGYVCSILLLFAVVFTAVLARSMKLGEHKVELTDFLEEMRYREMEERAKRQKKRLCKTKQRVKHWLNGKRSKIRYSTRRKKMKEETNYRRSVHKHNFQSRWASISYLPEIVVTESTEFQQKRSKPAEMLKRQSTVDEMTEDYDTLTPSSNNSPTSLFSMQFDFNETSTDGESDDGGWSTNSDSRCCSTELLAVPNRGSRRVHSIQETSLVLERALRGSVDRRFGSTVSFPESLSSCENTLVCSRNSIVSNWER